MDMSKLSGLSKDELLAFIAANAVKPKAISMKVSGKGALSVYGLGRFPVTLYRGQWERLGAAMPEIAAFIDANAALLSVKPGGGA